MPDPSEQAIGQVVALNGEAVAESDSGTRTLAIGSPIYENVGKIGHPSYCA